jgi:LuxR family transcriptional regulator, activator of tox operons
MCTPLPYPDPELGAALISAAKDASFAHLLLTAAQRLEAVEEVYASLIPLDGRPSQLCSSGNGCDSGECARSYARGFYQYDPALNALAGLTTRTGFSRRITAADINLRDYRRQCFERPEYTDKLSFGWRGQTHSLMVSFYRREGTGSNPLERLSGLAELALAALVRRVRDDEAIATLPLVARIEDRLCFAFPRLTLRERQVCAHTVAGHTAEQTALALGIAPVTVLTYRRRAYERLGFTQAADFIPAIMG